MSQLTHFDDDGKARMVDVGGKADTLRMARARGQVAMKPSTLSLIVERRITKGDVLTIAKVAGINSAKMTSHLIPLCHTITLTDVEVDFEIDQEKSTIRIEALAKAVGKTGAEMEALTAVSLAALTIYDMCKASDREMVISDIRLVEKSGGRSGHFHREGEA